MKFLIDAQLPLKLCEILQNAGINSIHITSLPEGDETSDTEICIYADKNDLIIITKDSDFYHSHMILGKPKKLFLITTGNTKNRKLFDLIRSNIMTIRTLFETCSFVEMTNDGLIGHE